MYLGWLENLIGEFRTYFLHMFISNRDFLEEWGFFMNKFGYFYGIIYFNFRSDYMLYLKLWVGL